MGVQDTLFGLMLALAFTACIKYLSLQDLHSCLDPCCQDRVAALFVEFEPFATTLDAAVEDLLAKCPGLHVIVASEEFPYPPPRSSPLLYKIRVIANENFMHNIQNNLLISLKSFKDYLDCMLQHQLFQFLNCKFC